MALDLDCPPTLLGEAKNNGWLFEDGGVFIRVTGDGVPNGVHLVGVGGGVRSPAPCARHFWLCLEVCIGERACVSVLLCVYVCMCACVCK